MITPARPGTLKGVHSLRLIRGGATTGVASTGPADDRFGDAAALVEGRRAGDASAREALVIHHGARVNRVLARVLGAGDPEQQDLVPEVFIRVLDGIDTLDDPNALPAWIASIAVFVARGCIRKRTRARWFQRTSPRPAPPMAAADTDAHEAMRCVYRIFDRMPADLRIVLALRKIEGMDLATLATVCAVSVPTIRRRLARAEERFARLAERYDVLAPWRQT